jgi:hypothetical protein
MHIADYIRTQLKSHGLHAVDVRARSARGVAVVLAHDNAWQTIKLIWG